MSLKLYENLIPITDFAKITESAGFLECPTGWFVILTDLRGSTKAIAQGRYKEVNLIGAAGIAVIKNVLGTSQFPFVFGGDGATCVLPKAETERVRAPLQQLQQHALKNFALELRVGIVPVSEVISRGGRIQIGKYQMGPGASIGLFRGGGLQIAEELIKADQNYEFVLPPASDGEAPPLAALSCRWAPIANRNGTIVSVMIQARELTQASTVLRQILQEIHPIFENEKNRPVHVDAMRLEGFWRSVRREWNLRQDLTWWLKLREVLLPSLIVKIMKFGSGRRILSRYLRETMNVSDYKKLDDTLRMTLDCSARQAQQLERVLRHHKNEIYYGMTCSDAALMTCIVEGMNEGEHIHFIDGASGGYALAAKQLKQQRNGS